MTDIFYLPGLGDGYDRLRRRALRRWRSKGVNVTFIPLNWRSKHESYQQKFNRIQSHVDNSHAENIVLVAESAGGSMAVAVARHNPSRVTKVITLFGKNLGAHRVSPVLYTQNPAFNESMRAADLYADDVADKFVCIYSPYDPVIRVEDTHIPGARLKKVRTPGHLISISIMLFIRWRNVMSEATK